MASPSRVWAFSRTSSSSRAACQVARSTTGGLPERFLLALPGVVVMVSSVESRAGQRRTTSYDGHQNRRATRPELIAPGGALGRACTDHLGPTSSPTRSEMALLYCQTFRCLLSSQRTSKPWPSSRVSGYLPWKWTIDEPGSGHLGRSELGAPGGPIHRDRHPGGGGPRLVHRQARRDALVREEAPAGADDHREHKQVEAVDEVVVEQESDEGAAAVHLELAPFAVLELPDSGGEVALEHRGVGPLRVLEGGRGDVLGQRVEAVRHRVVRIGGLRPGGGEDVVGAPAEEERVHLAEHLVDELASRLVEVGDDPAAPVEAAAAILLRTARALVDAVDRDKRRDDEPHVRPRLAHALAARTSRSLAAKASGWPVWPYSPPRKPP